MMVNIRRYLVVHINKVGCSHSAVVLLDVSREGRRGLLSGGLPWNESHVFELDALHYSASACSLPYSHVIAHVRNLRT